MEIKFSAGIGVPADFKVKYAAADKRICGYIGERKLNSRCKVISADFKLKIYFGLPDGEFLGLEYDCSPELLPAASLTKPFSLDGFIKLEKQPYAFNDINYVAFDKIGASYDKDEKLILIGEENGGLSFYKVCENTSVGVDCGGKISCFLIEI
ncbi:MAG: hypothetical protein ACI4QN_05545 [Candidatus Coproplasma sp.]